MESGAGADKQEGERTGERVYVSGFHLQYRGFNGCYHRTLWQGRVAYCRKGRVYSYWGVPLRAHCIMMDPVTGCWRLQSQDYWEDSFDCSLGPELLGQWRWCHVSEQPGLGCWWRTNGIYFWAALLILLTSRYFY